MWIDLLEDNRAITNIYGKHKPSLRFFKVKEINVKKFNNSLNIIGDLSSFPDDPPLKWKKGNFNTAQVVLEFWNLRALNLGDYFNFEIVDLNIFKDGDDITCEAENGFYCQAELIDILKISGYQNPISE